MLVLNDFAHVYEVEQALAGCYATHLAGRSTAGVLPSNASGVAHELARRDIVRYLSARAARIAALLAQSPLGRSLRVVYRTSSPAADRYLRGGAAIDVPVPLPHVAVDISAASAEYGHDIYYIVNALSVAAFRAVGHTVLDVEEMLGMRVDAHPAAHNPQREGDALHFCTPGPLDWVLDVLLRAVFGTERSGALQQ